MKRALLAVLKDWQKQAEHLPILLRGARQVGKTHLVESFGEASFDNVVTINFEESPHYLACFESLKPKDILNRITVLNSQTIIPGRTLLFLDEIQACPKAIMSLRYFKEQLPALHVIGAGSLLEFALASEGMRMPVGRVQYLYLKPLSFVEFLSASGNELLLESFQDASINNPLPAAIHNYALDLMREYMNIGGMPMVLDRYIQHHDLQECERYQTMLMRTYRDDFAKYAITSRHKYLQQVYERAPGLVGQQVKYSNIAPHMDSRYLKEAIADLQKANVITRIYAAAAAGLPLITYANPKKFKLLFLDVGLLKRASALDIEILFEKDLMLLNRGAIAEQLVGQELLAYQDPHDEPKLYFWARDAKSSTAEVDYVINMGSKIIPIEVKSGKTGTLKSLQILMEERKLPLGVRISEKPLQFEKNILSVPFYLISELRRLIRYCNDL